MEEKIKMPSKKRRLNIYRSAVDFIIKNESNKSSPYSYGLCKTIYDCDEYNKNYIKYNYPDPYEHMESYPEINKYKPMDLEEYPRLYWFSRDEEGIKKRIKILRQAIKELTPKKKTK